MLRVLRHAWDVLEARVWLWLTLILLLSATLRLAGYVSKDIPLPETRHQRIATSFAETGTLTYCNTYFPFCGPGNDATASVEPLPVLVFAACMALFGAAAVHVIVGLQLCIGVGTTLLVFVIIRTLFSDSRAALGGALLWATYIQMIALELTLYSEALFTGLLALGVLLLMRALAPQGKIGTWIGCGLCFGLAALSRSSFVYFPLVLGCGMLVIPALRHASSPAKLACWLAAFGLILLPWVVRNFLVFHAVVPSGTMNGYNLYRHNHFIASDEYLRYGRIEDVNAAIAHLIQHRSDLRGDENEYEMDRIYRQEALRIIAAHPARYLLLSLYRFIPLWTDIGVREEAMSLLLRFVGLENLCLLVLAVGLMLGSPRRYAPGTVALVLLIVYYTVGHMLVNARMRYMVPIMPYVIALAAVQGRVMIDRWLCRGRLAPATFVTAS